MNRTWTWISRSFGSLSALVGAIALPFPAIALCPADLPATVEAMAARPELAAARLGIQVETVAGESIYSREGDRFFVPASTLKLLTTAAVLTHLGPGFTIRTSIYGNTDDTGLTSLRVVGRGDPSFDREDMASLATQLVQAGVRHIQDLYGDESAFPGAGVNANWEWEDVQAGYGAPVNALILDENELDLRLVPQAIGEPLQVEWAESDRDEGALFSLSRLRRPFVDGSDHPAVPWDETDYSQGWQLENYSTTVPAGDPEFVRVGRALGRPVLRVWGQLAAGSEPEPVSIAIPNPGEAFLLALQSELAVRNVPIRQLRLTQVPAVIPWPKLASVQSPPLAELITLANQTSHNLYAEALLLQLGRLAGPGDDVIQSSLAIARRSLQELGVDPAAIVMVDGSGLARKNLVTPAAMVDVLQAMARSPHADTYQASLAVAGVSGTLRHRFRDTPVAGRLWGKSGAISRNFALAGYLEPPAYDAIAFSIAVNNINTRGHRARQIIDELVLRLAQLQAC